MDIQKKKKWDYLTNFSYFIELFESQSWHFFLDFFFFWTFRPSVFTKSQENKYKIEKSEKNCSNFYRFAGIKYFQHFLMLYCCNFDSIFCSSIIFHRNTAYLTDKFTFKVCFFDCLALISKNLIFAVCSLNRDSRLPDTIHLTKNLYE